MNLEQRISILEKKILGNKVRESIFSENINTKQIRPGDYVDFGSYGKLWICSIDGRTAWVTDRKKDAGDPDAACWSIKLSYAEKILSK